jgi:hypothetical protein
LDAQRPDYGPGGLLDLMQRVPLRINPAAWERFLREQTPSAYIEDRRRYDPYIQEMR